MYELTRHRVSTNTNPRAPCAPCARYELRSIACCAALFISTHKLRMFRGQRLVAFELIRLRRSEGTVSSICRKINVLNCAFLFAMRLNVFISFHFSSSSIDTDSLNPSAIAPSSQCSNCWYCLYNSFHECAVPTTVSAARACFDEQACNFSPASEFGVTKKGIVKTNVAQK